jgi:hypothetical protein
MRFKVSYTSVKDILSWKLDFQILLKMGAKSYVWGLKILRIVASGEVIALRDQYSEL